ncbi:hypothetical protein SGPA1_40281 [Streptomyces misionensis JCM 4497]
MQRPRPAAGRTWFGLGGDRPVPLHLHHRAGIRSRRLPEQSGRRRVHQPAWAGLRAGFGEPGAQEPYGRHRHRLPRRRLPGRHLLHPASRRGSR